MNRPTCSLKLLVGVFLVSVTADVQATDESQTGSGGTSQGSVSAGQVLALRNQCYASDASIHDEDTWVDGGSDGSGLLMIRDRQRKQTRWIFLHGNHMFLRVPGEKPEFITDKPGWEVTSFRGQWPKDQPTETDRRELTNYLRHFYRAHRVLHVPFLVGKGWHNDIGATLDETDGTLKRLDLRWILMGDPPDKTGHVIRQSPAAGRQVPPDTIVMLWLDGQQIAPKDLLLGDTHTNPREILDPDGDHQADVGAEITKAFNRDLPGEMSCPGGADVFWRLPDSAKGEGIEITATVTRPWPRVTLSAWESASAEEPPVPIKCKGRTDCCSYTGGPSIRFTAQKHDTYLVVSVAPDLLGVDPEWIPLHIAWRKSHQGGYQTEE